MKLKQKQKTLDKCFENFHKNKLCLKQDELGNVAAL